MTDCSLVPNPGTSSREPVPTGSRGGLEGPRGTSTREPVGPVEAGNRLRVPMFVQPEYCGWTPDRWSRIGPAWAALRAAITTSAWCPMDVAFEAALKGSDLKSSTVRNLIREAHRHGWVDIKGKWNNRARRDGRFVYLLPEQIPHLCNSPKVENE